MKLAVVQNVSKRPKGDLLAVPCYSSKGKAVNAFDNHVPPLAQGDFSGKLGKVLILYVDGVKEGRLALVGLGEKEKVTAESLRRAYAALVHACRCKKIHKLNVLVPAIDGLKAEETFDAVSEGILLANYNYDKHKSKAKNNGSYSITETTLIVPGSKRKFSVSKVKHVSESVHYCRDLVNGNADDVTPQHLAQCARSLAKKYSKVTATVFGKARIVKEKMGLLLAVNRGSKRDPAFIIVNYRGNPKSKKTIALVGKGITYDTGGLNLKKTGSMETMRCDMAGAATVLATIRALAALGAKVNVTGVIASTENGIDASSYKPGDVYTGYAGKSVEIVNTDAEGRLILADALAYTVKKLKPALVIDIATLTGAIVVALGSAASGLMTHNDDIATALQKAAERTGDRVWRMPLYEEYRKAIDSDIADIKNAGSGGAGAGIAGAFLQEFVGETPWAHLDIAGTAFIDHASYYNPKYGTGSGVRLLVDFLLHF
jgi:leucyl aminopeptidase